MDVKIIQKTSSTTKIRNTPHLSLDFSMATTSSFKDRK